MIFDDSKEGQLAEWDTDTWPGPDHYDDSDEEVYCPHCGALVETDTLAYTKYGTCQECRSPID